MSHNSNKKINHITVLTRLRCASQTIYVLLSLLCWRIECRKLHSTMCVAQLMCETRNVFCALLTEKKKQKKTKHVKAITLSGNITKKTNKKYCSYLLHQ